MKWLFQNHGSHFSFEINCPDSSISNYCILMLEKAVMSRTSTHLRYWQSNLVASATHCRLRASSPSREHARKKYQKCSASVNKLPRTLNNSWLQLRLKLQTLFKLHSSKGCQDFQKNQCNFFDNVLTINVQQVARRLEATFFVPFHSRPLLQDILHRCHPPDCSLSTTRLMHRSAASQSEMISMDLEWMPAYPRGL